ncbi:MAG TPA: plastocyanin/azurin family copper-binding protein [Solirubrobacteraceae bacterium]|jgi:plastocyanin
MRLMACLLAAAALAIAGCGGSSNSGSSGGGGSGGGSTSTPTPTSTPAANSGSGSSGGGKSVPVAADPNGALKFTTTTLKAKAGNVTFDFTNKSSIPHAIAIKGNGVNASGKVVTGGSDTLSVKLKPGTYEFYCPVDGHAAAGMKGTLTVS